MSQLKIITKILGIGLAALPQIEKPYERATAAAALLSSFAEVRKAKPVEDDEDTADEGNRLSLSENASGKEITEDAPAEEAAAEENMETEEWDETALCNKDIVDQFVESWGKDLVDEYYQVFTSNAKASVDELTPYDASPFVSYLYEVSAPAEESAE